MTLSHYTPEDVLPHFHVISPAPHILHYHRIRTAKKTWGACYTHYCIFVFLMPPLDNTSELLKTTHFPFYIPPPPPLSFSLWRNMTGAVHGHVCGETVDLST